jgi:MFS transporter, putative metabolite:H+ symporter
VLYTFQTFVPTILSAEGYSIVKSFRHSVVIYEAVIPGYIPGYVLGGHVVKWLDRKYAILFSLIAIGLCGTLFGLSRAPREIILLGGLAVFFLALSSTAIYTHTPELYPTEIRASGRGRQLEDTSRGNKGLNPVEETEYRRRTTERGAQPPACQAAHSNRPDATPRV